MHLSPIPLTGLLWMHVLFNMLFIEACNFLYHSVLQRGCHLYFVGQGTILFCLGRTTVILLHFY
jgi:hypothetical protein